MEWISIQHKPYFWVVILVTKYVRALTLIFKFDFIWFDLFYVYIHYWHGTAVHSVFCTTMRKLRSTELTSEYMCALSVYFVLLQRRILHRYSRVYAIRTYKIKCTQYSSRYGTPPDQHDASPGIQLYRTTGTDERQLSRLGLARHVKLSVGSYGTVVLGTAVQRLQLSCSLYRYRIQLYSCTGQLRCLL